MRLRFSPLSRWIRGPSARWIARGAFAFFFIKGLIWLAILAAAAWSATRIAS